MRKPLEVLRTSWRQARAEPLKTAVVTLVLTSTLLSAGSSLAALQAQHRSERAQERAEEAVRAVDRESKLRAHEACLALNENRRDARELMRRGDVDSGEALVQAATGASTPRAATQATIDLYRKLLAQAQANIIEEHKNDDLDCDQVAPLP